MAVSPLVNKVPYILLTESHESLHRFNVKRIKDITVSGGGQELL